MNYQIRRAVVSDAAQACQAVRRSIAELCVDDHQGDESTLTAWTCNKTAANFATWIVSDRHVALVAEGPSGVVGFGLLNREGTIALLYVSPEARFRGVSKALLAALEDAAIAAGVNQVRLASTATAISEGPTTLHRRFAETNPERS
jgi:GNAT superfamily N-acetyltransferase